ncbi:hypothetical protein D3C85_1446480 [compost metagenome]
MAVLEADDDFVFVKMAGILVIMACLNCNILQCIGMDRFHPVFAFLRIRNQPQVFELMIGYTVQNILADQGDDADISFPVTLSRKVILFIADNKGRGFVRLMPLNRSFC